MNLVRSLGFHFIVLLEALVWGVCALTICNMSQVYGVLTSWLVPCNWLSISIPPGLKCSRRIGARTGRFMEDGGARRAMPPRLQSALGAQGVGFRATAATDAQPRRQGLFCEDRIRFRRVAAGDGKLVSLCRAGDPKAAEQHSSLAIAPLYEDLAQTTAQWEQFNGRRWQLAPCRQPISRPSGSECSSF